MANHQINIAENGKKTLKTAGKYCDRDIDITVNVASSGGASPTPFTNILDLETTIVKKGCRCTSTKYTETVDGVAIVFYCPNGSHRIRVRGKYAFGYLQSAKATAIGPYYTNVYQATSTPTDSTFTGTIITDTSDWTAIGYFGQDEYGDFYIDVTTTADGYVGFNLKDMTLVYTNGTFACEPIITIDEPIGNGGGV